MKLNKIDTPASLSASSFPLSCDFNGECSRQVNTANRGGNQGVILGYIFLFQIEPTCRKLVPLANTISGGVMTETLSVYYTHTCTEGKGSILVLFQVFTNIA